MLCSVGAGDAGIYAERADLGRERRELSADPQGERDELTAIYVTRGLDDTLARQVATKLMQKDALGAHARDELGISEQLAARPVQAAFASAISFAAGALPPLLVAILGPRTLLPEAVGGLSIILLAVLGALGAKTGGANVMRGAIRVTFWGTIAMIVTAGIGALFGTHV